MRKIVMIMLGGLLSLSFTAAYAADALLLDKPAERIVVMDFGALDTLTELGGQSKIVALPKANIPEYLAQYNDAQYASTGDMKSPDLEAIRALNPDLIIISGRQGNAQNELKKIAPTVLLQVDANAYVESVHKNIVTLGWFIGKKKEAEQQWTVLENKIRTTQEQTKQSSHKALVMLHNDGKLMVSAESGYARLVHQVLGVVAADSTLGDKRVIVDAEYLTKTNPDVIYIIDRSAAIGQKALNLEFFKNPAMKDVNAIKNNKVVYLTPRLWYLSGNGLQSLNLQIDEVVKGLN